jgi:methionine-rich copper-binding protein CopC
VKFRSETAGTITGLRFYKGSGNTGTHVGHLWTSTGALLASATFSGETASGWQQVTLSTPVTVAANTTYVASYHTDVGHYASDTGYFANGVDNTPLHALASGVDGPNGVYAYGPSAFPTSSYQDSNYWVDVVFVPSGRDTTPPTVASTSPAAGAANVATGSSVAATFSEPVQPSTVTLTLTGPGGAAVAAPPASYNSSTQTETLTPSSPLANSSTYTATVAAGVKDLAGNATTAPVSWSFTTAASSPACTSCTIWAPTATPTVAADPDPASVELGVKVRSDVAGYIKGIRFYKSVTNTGTHTAHLWSSAGVSLGTATFSGETASGWQQVNFATPVAVNANTTYVASYHTSVGHYADDPGFFATSGVDNSPLHALAEGVDGPNGVYSYGAASTFPASAYQASNYWVDVVFSTTP